MLNDAKLRAAKPRDTAVEDLNGEAPLWRIPSARMKGDFARKDDQGGDHLVPLTPQAIAVLRALWTLTGGGTLAFPRNRTRANR